MSHFGHRNSCKDAPGVCHALDAMEVFCEVFCKVFWFITAVAWCSWCVPVHSPELNQSRQMQPLSCAIVELYRGVCACFIPALAHAKPRTIPPCWLCKKQPAWGCCLPAPAGTLCVGVPQVLPSQLSNEPCCVVLLLVCLWFVGSDPTVDKLANLLGIWTCKHRACSDVCDAVVCLEHALCTAV